MATITYHNGFDANSSRNVNYYTPHGNQVIEIWTNPMSFSTYRERREYFSGDHSEHCLTVEIDEIDGDKVWLFYYDDQPANIPPNTQTLPSDDELVAMLENYG